MAVPSMLIVAPRGSTKEATSRLAPSFSVHSMLIGRVPTEEPLKDIEDVKDYFTGNCDKNRKRERGWSMYTLELMEVKED